MLPTIDAIDQRLRQRLGEALAAVSATSKPLEQVTTANLDALRAYSLGQRAYFTGDMRDALAQYRQALDLDPDFATARIAVAIIHLKRAKILWHCQTSGWLWHTKIVDSRDVVYADAREAVLVDPRGGLEKLKSVADLYPEIFPRARRIRIRRVDANALCRGNGGAKRNATANSACRCGY